MSANQRAAAEDNLRRFFGIHPGTPKLRRYSGRVVEAFMIGCSMQSMADRLGVHIALIEDAVRWYGKRGRR